MKYLVIDVAAESYGAMSVLKDFYSYASKDTDNEWVFLLSGPYLEEQKHIQICVDTRPKKNWLYRFWWEFTEVRKFVKKHKPDRIISLQNIIAFGCRNYPQMLYMHMPLPFQKVKKFSFFKKNERTMAIYQYIIGKLIIYSIKHANTVIVQGEWLKNSIKEKCKTINDIMVFPTEITFPENLSSVDYVDGNTVNCKSFCYPVAPSIFKNHECIFEAAKNLIDKGYSDFKIYLTCEKKESYPDLKQFEYLGKVSREKVFELLKTSVLLFPSYIETFGLPLLEARAVGAVEFASDCPFSHEILDDYPNAYFFNPFVPDELSDLMAMLLENKISYTKQDFIFPSQYTWKEIIDHFENGIKN